MRLFERADDFADIAADPERRHAKILDLKRSSRLMGWVAFLFITVTLMLVWDQNVGAVGTGLFAALAFSFGARLESDVHLLQVLDHMGNRREIGMG